MIKQFWSWHIKRKRLSSTYLDHPWFAGKAFTQDWTTNNLDNWHRVFLAGREDVTNILEIGCHEGRSAVFFLNFFRKARLTCIDIFGQDGVEQRFDANMAEFGDRVTKLKARSVTAMAGLIDAGDQFDLIYIDANHDRDAVLADSLLAWSLLERGGILIWDDYRWTDKIRRRHHPKYAIDIFLKLHRSRLKVLHRGYQVIARRRPASTASAG